MSLISFNSFLLQVLESAGVMKKIKRVAGASAGAITATLIAIGFNSQELKEFLEQDLKKILVGKIDNVVIICRQVFYTSRVW